MLRIVDDDSDGNPSLQQDLLTNRAFLDQYSRITNSIWVSTDRISGPTQFRKMVVFRNQSTPLCIRRPEYSSKIIDGDSCTLVDYKDIYSQLAKNGIVLKLPDTKISGHIVDNVLMLAFCQQIQEALDNSRGTPFLTEQNPSLTGFNSRGTPFLTEL